VRWIVHVDMDAYFASLEQLVNPALRGRPVIVGGRPGTRSTVSTASYEAREYGVKSGMSIGEASRLCPHGVFLPGSTALYLHTSKRIFELLRQFSTKVEPASIDEAYLELETDDPVGVASRIQARIDSDIGLTASLGISESKYLAKIAAGFAKPRGLTFLPRSAAPEKLWPLPVAVLPGVGVKTAARLASHGWRTVGDLATAPAGALEHALGMRGASLRRRVHGLDRGRVTPPSEAPDAKSIGHEHTLEHDLYDRSAIEAMLSYLVQKVGRRARRHALAGRRLVLKLRDRHFHTITHGRMLAEPLDDDVALFRIAAELLGETRFWERGIRLVGVHLELLVHVDAVRQLTFDFAERGRALPVVDSIRSKHGERAIGLARALATGRDPGAQRIAFAPPRDATSHGDA